MTAAFWTEPFQQVLDSNTDALAGAKLYFYNAGTLTQRTTYSDSARTTPHAHPVVADSGGRFSPIYMQDGTYKVILKSSADVTIYTADNVTVGDGNDAAVAVTDFTRPTIFKGTNATLTDDEVGSLVVCDCSSGSLLITLPSAALNEEGTLVIKHNGSANVVTVLRQGTDYIRHGGIANRTAVVLLKRGETIEFVSDGADWQAAAGPAILPSPIPIVDRLTAPPAGTPTPGGFYLINGTPTDAWSSYQQHDILQFDGSGSYILWRPTTDCGWIGSIQDEGLLVWFRGSAWIDLSNVTAPTTSTLKAALFLAQYADGTDGGGATVDEWTTSAINTTKINTITGASLASNAITLPAGTYFVNACRYLAAANSQMIRLKLANGGTPIYYEGITNVGGTQENLPLPVHAVFTLAASDTLTMEYYVSGATGGTDLGTAIPTVDNLETYASIQILELTAQQGPQGIQGPQGADGLDASYPYTFSTATTGEPADGALRLNHATPASATEIAVSEVTSTVAPMSAILATWDDSTSAKRATVRISKEDAPNNVYTYRITGAGSYAGTTYTFPVEFVSANGTISNGNALAVAVIPTGDKGDPGVSVPDVSGLTEDTANDDEADFVMGYDTSASAQKKVKPKNLGFTQSGGTLRTLQSKLREGKSFTDFGGSTANSAAANTTAFAAAITALSAGQTLVIPSGTYAMNPVTISKNKITVRGELGAEFTFASLGVGATAITVTGENCFIDTLTLTGPAAAAFVSVERGIYFAGASSASRKSGLTVRNCIISQFGYSAIGAKWATNIVVENCYVNNCGYFGVELVSVDQFWIEKNRIKTITPGTSSNMYGISITHDNSGYFSGANPGTKQHANPFSSRGFVRGNEVEDINWEGIDCHGAYEIVITDNRVFNTKLGISCPGGSGDAAAYAGYSNIVARNIVDGRNSDGTTSGREHTGYGISVSGTTTSASTARGVICSENIVLYKGIASSAGGASINAQYTRSTIVADNIVRFWAGNAIILEGGQGICSGNLIGPHSGIADTYKVCIVDATTTGTWRLYGNVHQTDGGSAALEGFRQNSGGANTLAGNDFAAATTPYINATDAVFSAFGKTLIDDADASASRTTLGLGTIATQNANAIAITGGTLSGITSYDMAAPSAASAGVLIASRVRGPTRAVTGAESNFFIGLDVQAITANIASGITDSGYRVGLRFDALIQDANFSGTLAAQYGIFASVGISSAAGSGARTITNAYGMYLNCVNTAGTITNKWGIYQVGTTFTNYFDGVVRSNSSFNVSGTKVVGARDTGWSAFTGTANENSVYDTATVTLVQLAERVNAIQTALTTHGLIGA